AEARGPFSMDSRFDVRRAAIAASAKVLVEALGLVDADAFEKIARETLSTWSDVSLLPEKSTSVVVHAIADAIGEVLRMPLSRFPLASVEQLLQVAGSLPKDTRRIDGTAWVNFVRPAIEVVAAEDSRAPEQVENIRRTALSLIPDWSPGDVSSTAEPVNTPPFPPEQHDL